jgi:hypothetical protein
MLRWQTTVACVAAVMATAGASPSAAQGALRAMCGDWVLLSVYEEDSSGYDIDRWGTAPQGRFTASPNGDFSFLLVGRNVTRIASSNVERACVTLKACRDAIEQRVVGYSGKLSESPDGTVFLNVTGELERGWKDAAIVTSVRFEGDTMHFTSALHASPTGAFYVHLVWSRKE